MYLVNLVDFCTSSCVQGSRAPGQKYNLADASGCQLLSQTECKWLIQTLSAVSGFLRSPPSSSSFSGSFLLPLFFFNKNSFPSAVQQLMSHPDTTNATRPQFNRATLGPESTVCLLLQPGFTVCISSLSAQFSVHFPFCSSVHPSRRQT